MRNPMQRQKGASTLMVHAALAVIALGAAYMTWTRDKVQVQSDTVTILDAGKRDIDSVTYEDESRTVVVERKTNASGDSYAWVTTTTRQKSLLTNPLTPPPGMPTSPHGAPGAPGVPGAPTSPHGAPPSPHGAPPAMAPGAPGAPAPVKAATPPGPPVRVPVAPPARVNGAKAADKAAADKDDKKAPTQAAPGTPAASAAPAGTPAAPGAAATQPGAPAAAEPAKPIHEVKETVVVKSFRGNEQADKLLDSFGPLLGLRALGSLDDAKLKELGLTESKKSMTIQVKGKPTKLMIGNTSYGSGDIYVRDQGGQVYLLSQHFSGDFEYADSRLMERRMHRFDRADISKVEITVGNKKRVLVQQKRQDPANFFWALDSSSDKRDDTVKNWMDKVLRLAISDYVAKGDEPQQPAMSQPPGPSGVPQFGEVMTMRFYDGGKVLGEATFSRYPKGTQTEYFAKTETTIGLVRLLSTTAESVIQDAEKW